MQPKIDVDMQEFKQYGSFQASDITIEERTAKKQKPEKKDDYVFGQITTDHMLEINWSVHDGWAKPKILPYGSFRFRLGAQCLHYGMQCYEGFNVL